MAFMNKKKALFLLILLCLSVCICVAQDDDFIDVFDDDEVEIKPSVKIEENKSSSLKQEPKLEIKKNASETEKITGPCHIFSCPGVVPNEAYFRNKENMRRRREEFLKKYASETIDVNQSASETKKLENSNSNDEEYKTEDMDDFGLYDIDEEVEFDNNKVGIQK